MSEQVAMDLLSITTMGNPTIFAWRRTSPQEKLPNNCSMARDHIPRSTKRIGEEVPMAVIMVSKRDSLQADKSICPPGIRCADSALTALDNYFNRRGVVCSGHVCDLIPCTGPYTEGNEESRGNAVRVGLQGLFDCGWLRLAGDRFIPLDPLRLRYR